MAFPKNFRWGVSTASYQIEGSALASGGGKSVWDMFCERPGAVFDNGTGWTACDHFHRFKSDIALMKSLGIKAYRLSISWPRVIPAGTGTVSEAGLAFYDDLIDTLLEAGIEPWVTLFHWDYPYDLYNQGGWLNPASSQWFEDYAKVVVDRLSDRVGHWMTLNEPQCFIGLGHLNGNHAPGDKLQLSQVLVAAHNTLLSHGKAVKVIRERSKLANPKVGMAPVSLAATPLTLSDADIEAARRSAHSVPADSVWSTSWWTDPAFLGHYPEEGLKAYGKFAPKPAHGDMETIKQPLDFFGANIYHCNIVKAGENGDPINVEFPQGTARTVYGWPVTPSALYWGPKFMYERYGVPIVITENGLSNMDWVHVDGKIHDASRIDFLTRYILEFERAHTDGVDVAGYFQWSFMDNFEWNEGYKHRFGLVYVDFETLERIPKDSAYWYKQVIETNGRSLSE